LDSLTGIFTTPIDIEIWTNQYPQTQRILIDKTDEEFLIPCENPPKNVVFDKGSKVLKKINIEKTTEEWMFQLKNSGPIDRLIAVKMLGAKTDETDVKQALSKALFSDKCWFIRVEAASALGNSTLKSNAELLIDAYRDKNPDVRSAVLNALSNFHGHNIIQFLKNVFEQDTCYAVMEAALTALVKVDPQNAVSYCEKGLTIESHRNKIVVASIRNLAETGTENAYKVIFPYTKYGMETAVRGQAILSLSENWPDEKDVLETADKMSNEQNYYIRMNAYLALEKIGNEEAIKSLKNASKSEKQARLLKIIREALWRLIYKN
jgi:aminopeptidase N